MIDKQQNEKYENIISGLMQADKNKKELEKNDCHVKFFNEGKTL